MKKSDIITEFTKRYGQDECKNAKRKYNDQMQQAKKRNIQWDFTLDTWLKLWMDSGIWHKRGIGADKYCMCRTGDVGPYSIDNVKIDLQGQNTRDAHLGKSYKSDELKERLRDIKKGVVGKNATNTKFVYVREDGKKYYSHELNINGFNVANVNSASNGNRKTAHGYKWSKEIC